MANENETINVLITAKQTVYYKQVRSFTRDDWERFKKRDERQQGDEITDRLDLRHVYDSEEIEEFTATVCDREGRPIKPADVVEVN